MREEGRGEEGRGGGREGGREGEVDEEREELRKEGREREERPGEARFVSHKYFNY